MWVRSVAYLVSGGVSYSDRGENAIKTDVRWEDGQLKLPVEKSGKDSVGHKSLRVLTSA